MVTWERTRDDVGSHGVGDGIVPWLVVWTEVHRIVDWYDAS